jgi:hypothetical protein
MKPSDDPNWRLLTPEQQAFREAYASCQSIAEGIVLIFAKFGLSATAGFLRDVKYDREQLRNAARDLRRVTGFSTLADLTELAAKTKPKPWPNWPKRYRAEKRLRTRTVPAEPLIKVKPQVIKHLRHETA